MKMQNIWLVGIVLTALVGSGAVMGMGAMNDHYGMHGMMHGMHDEDCYEHQECEYEGEECHYHSEEECDEEHEECIKEHEDCYMDEHGEDHGCVR